ncbi:MAG: ADP-ribosylglycohydrolase family protein [Bythopirellula sp.]
MCKAIFLGLLLACGQATVAPAQDKLLSDSVPASLSYPAYAPRTSDRIISRSGYGEKLYGFWLAECIANWTGLVTEMDKIGDTPQYKTGKFYTRDDWGKPDQPSIWSNAPSRLSPTIDFVFRKPGEVWGADDDTDIEYLYQHLLLVNKTSLLTARQIRDGWLKHIKSAEENFLWVSNERAYRLMETGLLPPATSHPDNNPNYEMIDAQLSTEIFGLFAPTRPDFALKMAHLPIRTTARENAAWIAEFYVTMHALAALQDDGNTPQQQLTQMAKEARKGLPDHSYAAKMHDFVESMYGSQIPWEQARDAVHQRYQLRHADGYDMSDHPGNGCFAAGINFAASLISLYYGEGDLLETIKIGTLAGWDSDNPTATWGGLLGFMLGRRGVENVFGRQFSDRYDIHRTRRNFPRGVDDFASLANRGILVVDRVVQEELNGGVDLEKDCWYIPRQLQAE